MSDSNYYDLLKTSEMSQYFSYLNDKFIKMSGPNIRVFKLDKKATVLDDVYGTDRGSRIYLPMFNIRGIYKTNPWVSDIGLEPYGELEQKITIVVNFDNMVATLRDLKNKHTCDISIECISSTVVPSIQKLDGIVTLFINGNVVKVINLSVYRTVKSFVNAVNSATQFKATYTGVSDEINKIDDFNEISFQGSVLSLFVEDTTYANITEVIEMGDILLTEKWRAYEVKSAMPGGDFGWNYSTFVMEGGLLEMDVLDGLPGNYRLQIEQHQLGQPKISRE